MSVTDELRRMLDERGVGWIAVTPLITYFKVDSREFRAYEYDGMGELDGLQIVNATPYTPAQAIAATLGSDDTFTREDVEGAFVSGYSLGLDMFDSSKQEKGWNQNERNLDEEMEDLGWVRKDAATLGRGECEADETDTIKCWVKCKDEPSTERMELIHVMECSACGGTYEHVNGSYEFCPRCGRKLATA